MSGMMFARKSDGSSVAGLRLPPKTWPRSLKVSEPGDAYEREADRVANSVMNDHSISGWSISKINLGQVQRQTPPTGAPDPQTPAPKSNNYEEGAEKLGEAFLQTPAGKNLLSAISDDPLAKALSGLAGKAIVGTAAISTVAALAATHKALPMQIPEIPLEKVRSELKGLSVKITYEGPVDHPTKAMITFTYKPEGEKKKDKQTESEKYRAETARIAADQQKFREGLKYPPGSPQDLEQKAEQKAFDDYTLHRFGALPGTGDRPLIPPAFQKQQPDTGLRMPTFESPFKPRSATLLDKKLELKPMNAVTAPPQQEGKQEERPVQRKGESSAALGRSPSAFHSVDKVLSDSGQPLNHATRSLMESRIRYDFSNVRIYTGLEAAASAKAMGALAYTVGNSIVFGTDQYSPSSTEGRKLLAHELTHTVQQSGGVSRDSLLPSGAGLARASARKRFDESARAWPKALTGKAAR